jgi:hypothetical protein
LDLFALVGLTKSFEHLEGFWDGLALTDSTMNAHSEEKQEVSFLLYLFGVLFVIGVKFGC